MNLSCARCDYEATDHDELVAHAVGTGHWLCPLCGRSLASHEVAVCGRCVGRARADLADIAQLYAELPSMLTGYSARSGPSDHTRGNESPMPGGDALVMLAGGSEGNAYDRHGNNAGEVPGVTVKPGDPPSIVFDLSRYEDDWRQVRGEPAGGKATISGVVGYLNTRLTWASETLREFPEFAMDLRRMRAELYRLVGDTPQPVVAAADCFDCGGRLERGWTDAGLDDDWTCARCGRRYDTERYYLAVRARLEDQAASDGGAA